MLFLFSVAHDTANAERIAWLCAGVARVNGAMLFDTDGFTHDPSADPSHTMHPRGSWGSAEREHEEDDASVEWLCGRCGAANDTPAAQAPCPRR